jgi:hypothetical protein
LLDDAEWLQRTHLVERRSVKQIAHELGCAPATVKRALRRHDIPLRMQQCGCGCGAPVPDDDHPRYIDNRHKQRAYRRRVADEMHAHGLPAALSLKAARSGDPTSARNGDAQNTREAAPRGREAASRRRRAPDLRISWRKAVGALAAELDDRQRAEAVLRPLLTDRQRRAVDEEAASS